MDKVRQMTPEKLMTINDYAGRYKVCINGLLWVHDARIDTIKKSTSITKRGYYSIYDLLQGKSLVLRPKFLLIRGLESFIEKPEWFELNREKGLQAPPTAEQIEEVRLKLLSMTSYIKTYPMQDTNEVRQYVYMDVIGFGGKYKMDKDSKFYRVDSYGDLVRMWTSEYPRVQLINPLTGQTVKKDIKWLFKASVDAHAARNITFAP